MCVARSAEQSAAAAAGVCRHGVRIIDVGSGWVETEASTLVNAVSVDCMKWAATDAMRIVAALALQVLHELPAAKSG
jgi:hypothetical protein